MMFIKNGWTTLKFIRVALGILILYSSIQEGQVAGMIAGGIFTIFSLFTDGVCYAGSSCYRQVKNNTSPVQNIEYEELDIK